MNWSSHEFIWLDWAVLTLGIIAVICAVYISIVRDKRKMKRCRQSGLSFWKR